MNVRPEGKRSPPYIKYIGIEEHETHLCPDVRPKHRAVHLRSFEALYNSGKSKYVPHQGKKECQRRLNTK